MGLVGLFIFAFYNKEPSGYEIGDVATDFSLKILTTNGFFKDYKR
jgi:hypothetical protein